MAWPAGGPATATAGTTADAADANTWRDGINALSVGHSEISGLTAEDLLVASDGNTFGRLAKGSNGEILSMVAGSVAWAANSAVDPLPLTTDAPATPDADTLYADTIVKAWVKVSFSGGTPSIDGDVNVASLVDNGVGNTTVTYARAMGSANYGAVAAQSEDEQSGGARLSSFATGSIVVTAYTGSQSPVDRNFTMIVVGAN